MLVAYTIDAPADHFIMRERIRCTVGVKCIACTDNSESKLFGHRLGDTLGDSSVKSRTMHPFVLSCVVHNKARNCLIVPISRSSSHLSQMILSHRSRFRVVDSPVGMPQLSCLQNSQQSSTVKFLCSRTCFVCDARMCNRHRDLITLCTDAP